MKQVPEGKHIKINGKGDPKALGNVDNVKSFLKAVVDSVGMRCLDEPVMYDVELQLEKMKVTPFEDEGGVTGVVVLSTSHASIHTWPLRNLFVFDIYSCRDFEHEKMSDLLKSYFDSLTHSIFDVSYTLPMIHE